LLPAPEIGLRIEIEIQFVVSKILNHLLSKVQLHSTPSESETIESWTWTWTWNKVEFSASVSHLSQCSAVQCSADFLGLSKNGRFKFENVDFSISRNFLPLWIESEGKNSAFNYSKEKFLD
jgi:hypothetical protein